MKKAVLTLMLTVVSAIFLNAQSLTGKPWYAKLLDDEGTEIVLTFTFETDGTYELIVATEYEIKEDNVPINLIGGVAVPGTYTRKGNDLKLKPQRNKAEVELDYDIKGMDAKTKALMDKEIRDEINGLKNEFKNEMLDGLPKMQNMKIVSLESKRLILKDDAGDEIPFYSE